MPVEARRHRTVRGGSLRCYVRSKCFVGSVASKSSGFSRGSMSNYCICVPQRAAWLITAPTVRVRQRAVVHPAISSASAAQWLQF